MKINLNHLYQFYLTAKEGSIKKAAKSLHVTEPTISKQIKDLEEYLETYLFRRENNQLLITPLGKELMDRAEKVFQSVEEIEYLLGRKTSGVVNKLLIGAAPLLYPYLARFFDMDFSGSGIDLANYHCLNNDDLEEKLQERQIDVAITDFPLSIENFHCIKLIDLPLILVGKSDFASLGDGFPDSLKGQPQVVLNRKYKVQEDVDHFLSHHQAEPNKRIYADSFELCREAALRGNGVTVVPPQVVTADLKNGSLVEITKLPNLVLSIWLIALKSRIEEPLVKKALDHTFPQAQNELFELRP